MQYVKNVALKVKEYFAWAFLWFVLGWVILALCFQLFMVGLEVSGNTKSKSESKKWYEFTSAITKAKTIDIFIENEIISTIYPKNPTALKDLAQCKSMYDRPKIGV